MFNFIKRLFSRKKTREQIEVATIKPLFQKPERLIHTVFLHCSDSDYESHDHIDVIRSWHVNGNGWKDVGYHFYISKRGGIQQGRHIEVKPAAQYRHNEGTIAICLGGSTYFSKKQKEALIKLCREINEAYGGAIRFRGHKEVDAKRSCPVYPYKEWLGLSDIGYMSNKEYL